MVHDWDVHESSILQEFIRSNHGEETRPLLFLMYKHSLTQELAQADTLQRPASSVTNLPMLNLFWFH